MPMLRLPGGCIAFVPISPDATKILIGARFGLADLLRYLVMWGDHPRWSRRMVFNGLLVLTIGDGARPGSRRMIPDLQPPMAEGTGSRHARSSFHPSSRLARA